MSGNPEQNRWVGRRLGRLAAVDDALGWAVDVLQGMGREVVAAPVTLKDRPWSRVVRLRRRTARSGSRSTAGRRRTSRPSSLHWDASHPNPSTSRSPSRAPGC